MAITRKLLDNPSAAPVASYHVPAPDDNQLTVVAPVGEAVMAHTRSLPTAIERITAPLAETGRGTKVVPPSCDTDTLAVVQTAVMRLDGDTAKPIAGSDTTPRFEQELPS